MWPPQEPKSPLLHLRALVPSSCLLGSLALFTPGPQKIQHPYFLSLGFPVSITSIALVSQLPTFHS